MSKTTLDINREEKTIPDGLVQKWPVLKKYDRNHLAKIALPVGGIGTGTVSLGGRGDLRDWEIVNRPGKKFNPASQGIYPFLAVNIQSANGTSLTKILEGPVELTDYEGASGSEARNHGFPRFRNCEFQTAYPFGQCLLSDPEMPVKAKVKAFNPLIPQDSDSSSYPAVILKVEITNTGSEQIKTGICISIPNFIGEDGTKVEKGGGGYFYTGGAKANKNIFRESTKLSGIYMTAPKLCADSEQYGNMYISTNREQDITYRTGWSDLSWGDSKLDFWDDFTEDGKIDPRESNADKPIGSLCINNSLAAEETKEVTFILTWHFPNRKTWSNCAEEKAETIGNYYTTCFSGSGQAAEKIFTNLAELEKKTIEFVSALCDSSFPESIKEAALFNLSTLRTQTCFRTPDGKLYGWEGCHDSEGCCRGSCTHVWNYEQATAFLFGDLAKGMREVEFKYTTNSEGHMAFRVELPLDKAKDHCSSKNVAAADGQMGCIMKLYRDWQLSGDEKMLKELYPKAKKAITFSWCKGGWDEDCDGLMEGCQHNTMDVEYYGPNPQMGFWYLGALRAMQKMAEYMKDMEFSEKCSKLFKSGSKAIDERLFNGEYYEHIIEPQEDSEKIAPGLTAGLGSKNLKNPDFQLGAGCLIDQMVGQYMAHSIGLGYLSQKENQLKTLKSIFKYNFKENFHNHFNHHRSYVLGSESAVLMATYPLGRRPKRPFPYYNEVMTGFEYTLAVHMFYEGLTHEGVKIINAIRKRYDGKKRSPFDEAECGHHYARAMASWAAITALSGFKYSEVDKTMEFKAQNGTYFWSNGYAWGTCTIEKNKVQLSVKSGIINLHKFILNGAGKIIFKAISKVSSPKTLNFEVA